MFFQSDKVYTLPGHIGTLWSLAYPDIVWLNFSPISLVGVISSDNPPLLVINYTGWEVRYVYAPRIILLGFSG